MSNEVKPRVTPSRQGLYAKAASYALEAIEILANEMRNGDNSNARTGAAKALLAKAIPDLRAMEITGQDGQPFKILVVPPELISKYAIPSNTEGSSLGQPSIQNS